MAKKGVFETSKEALNCAYITGKRVRIYYGDTTTGRDWMEEYDTIGRVSKSTGVKPRFILLPRKDSLGGGAITESIVKITAGKEVLYCHASYHHPNVHIVVDDAGIKVCYDQSEQARFDTHAQAVRYVRFIRGDVNTKGGRA